MVAYFCAPLIIVNTVIGLPTQKSHDIAMGLHDYGEAKRKE